MAANFAKLPDLLRGTVEAAGQRLFAFHFPEHTGSVLAVYDQSTSFQHHGDSVDGEGRRWFGTLAIGTPAHIRTALASLP